jgi:hypothetical protein
VLLYKAFQNDLASGAGGIKPAASAFQVKSVESGTKKKRWCKVTILVCRNDLGIFAGKKEGICFLKRKFLIEPFHESMTSTGTWYTRKSPKHKRIESRLKKTHANAQQGDGGLDYSCEMGRGSHHPGGSDSSPTEPLSGESEPVSVSQRWSPTLSRPRSLGHPQTPGPHVSRRG